MASAQPGQSGGVTPTTPSSPPYTPPTSPPHTAQELQLWQDVKNTLVALPSYFTSPLALQGIPVTDLFTFAASLGATIEEQVVSNLNRLRSTTWDKQGQYAHYTFERQPQRFPDVILTTRVPGLTPPTLLGIELKGWYILAKEGEPTFRYEVTPAVCSELDLLVVFPWALSSVVSGSPVLFAPFVTGARHAAEYRNWYWQFGMQSTGNKAITISQVTVQYPVKSDAISDEPAEDSGGNFGRVSRGPFMDTFNKDASQQLLTGIPIDAWRRFFKVFTERPDAGALNSLLATLERRQQQAKTPRRLRQQEADRLIELFDELAGKLK